MSRVHRIRVGETGSRLAHAQDGVSSTLALLPILPRRRMAVCDPGGIADGLEGGPQCNTSTTSRPAR